MIDSTRAGGTALPDNPPNVVLKRARGQATALARCIYVYHSRSKWVMTADLNEPPSEAAVWIVAANQYDPESQNRDGC
jgi:hypothetical protein